MRTVRCFGRKTEQRGHAFGYRIRDLLVTSAGRSAHVKPRGVAMNVIRRRSWEIPDRDLTPEHLFLSRRTLLAGARAFALGAGAAPAQRISDLANRADPTADLYPAKHNDKYVLDRPITEEKINAHYNNFYEFNSSKEVAEPAQALPIRPWTVKLDGMVEKEQTIAIDDLIRKMTLEER